MRPDPTWTAGASCDLPDEGLHQTVARIARHTPDAVALADERGHAVTYGELDRLAGTWAAGLAEERVGPGHTVPVLLPRGTDLVVALLAVLKTGAAYALLDPAWPDRRVREAVEDMTPPLLVTRPGANDASVRVWHPPAGGVAEPFAARPVSGGDACCVFFTSGTTGRPKGVLTTHRATARVAARPEFVRVHAGSVIPLAAPMSWDAFSLELWSALLNGGTSLVVAEPYLTVESLRRAVTVHRADTVWLTSSLFDMIVDEDVDAFAGLAHVMAGGERLSPAHVGRFLRRHPGIALVNGYGPVESTIFATTHRVVADDCDRPEGVPLGRPVRGTRVHVLDGDAPCAVGEIGEICIGGDGLALGYLGDPELTAAKFPSVEMDGRVTRVFRTGDLGTWGADGLLRFAGRADRQLKVRGHRVEPAEVERQLARLLPVRACRVVGRPVRGTRELVAFCVPARPGDRLEGALDLLRDEVVAYQRPAAVVSVEAFPLNPQGKLDEQALLALLPPPGDCQDAPSGDATVETVREVFADVLGRPAVPADVSFFDLGGTSLDAGRVCARIGAVTGWPVPVSRLYRHPVAASFASWLRSVTVVADDHAQDEVPLSPMQMVFLTRLLGDPRDRTGHCLLTWVVEGSLDLGALEAAVTAVHDRHPALRAAYVPDPRATARVVDVPPPPVEKLPPQPTVGAAVAALREELAEALDPMAADVWRVAVVPVSDDVAVIGCVVHHIAFDGWSESILASDLSAAYDAAQGLRPRLAAGPATMPVPVTDDDPRARDDAVRELSGAPDLAWPIPATGPRGSATIETLLVAEVVAAADRRAARAGVSRFVLLLSAFGASLVDVTGQRDFVVGVPVRQRPSAALETAIGCHLTMACVRLRDGALAGDDAAARMTKDVVTRAFARQDVPITEVLTLVRRPNSGRPPLFQVLFALQDNPVPHLDLATGSTTFVRQPYLDLPLELHLELWPDGEGLRVQVSYRTDAVTAETARAVADGFVARVSERRGT